jgi:prophage antirepressor-like protein
MSNLPQIFSYQQNQVRTVVKDGEPYFVLKDVCEILAIQNHKDVSSRLDEDEKGVDLIDTLGGTQQMTVINESGLYNVILRSDKQEAKQFRKWITSDVLPSIRKHGMYAKDELLDNPDLLIEVATRLKEEREKNKLLDTENKLLAQQTLIWADRRLIDAIVKKYGAKIGFEVAWREFKKELLYAHSINLQSRVTNYLNNTGKKTKPKTLDMIHDEELSACVSTAIALCKANNINIDDILKKYNVA